MATGTIKKHVIQEQITAMEDMLDAKFQNLTVDQSQILDTIINDYLLATYLKATITPVLTDKIKISENLVYMDFKNARGRPSPALPPSAEDICVHNNIVPIAAKQASKLLEGVTP